MPALVNLPWPEWEIVRLIGHGSFGTVYEIRRKLVDGDIETAAVKVITLPQNPSDIDQLHSEGYDDESITETFHTRLKSIVTEYSLMRKMDGSANVVNCKDIAYIRHPDGIGWDIYIRMELLTPLLKALPTTVPESTVVRIGRDMCNALILCKMHEIVHRDIKPQNIFVSPNGDYKLGDFGIAKTMESTMGGTRTGTYKYMAPEVYNNKPYGSAADIYSLGLVMYWLLNMRRMPFVPLPPEKITMEYEEKAWLRRVSGEKMFPPVYGCEELKRIVLKACAYDPKDRYSSAVEMLEDIHKLEETMGFVAVPVIPDMEATVKIPVAAPEDPDATVCVARNRFCTGCGNPLNGQQKFCPKCGKPVAAAAAAPKPEDPDRTVNVKHAPPVAAPVYVAEMPVQTPVTPKRKEKKEKGKKKGLIIVLLLLVVAILGGAAYMLFFHEPEDKASTKKSKDKEQTQETEQQTEQATEQETQDTQPSGECVHDWQAATCQAPATCALCKETTGELGDHLWTDATCTAPMQCSLCGVTEGEENGHSWRAATKTDPATCSACGMTSGTRILPTLVMSNLFWSGGTRPQCECDNSEAVISSSMADFTASEVTVKSPTGQPVDMSQFELVRNADSLRLVFKDTVPEGGYDFTFTCQSGVVNLSLCYGYAGEIYLEQNNLDWVNRKFQNWSTKAYLVQTPTGYETNTAYASASVIAGRKQMCNIAIEDPDFAYPIIDGTMITLTTNSYTLHGGSELWVFTYDGWYLATDTDGNVFFTKTLTNECYWSCVA